MLPWFSWGDVCTREECCLQKILYPGPDERRFLACAVAGSTHRGVSLARGRVCAPGGCLRRGSRRRGHLPLWSGVAPAEGAPAASSEQGRPDWGYPLLPRLGVAGAFPLEARFLWELLAGIVSLPSLGATYSGRGGTPRGAGGDTQR